MKVGSRLALGFSTLIVIGIVVAVFGRIQLERLADEVQLLVDDRMVKVEQITEAINNINLIARAVRNIAPPRSRRFVPTGWPGVRYRHSV